MVLLNKTLREVTRIGFPLYRNALVSCTDFFHRNEPKFYLKHDVHKSFLNCKGKPMKDTYIFVYYFEDGAK